MRPLTVYDAAVAAGLISRAVLAAHVNGKLCALTQMLDGDADVELLTFADEDGSTFSATQLRISWRRRSSVCIRKPS